MADVMHKDTTATKLNSINYSPKKKYGSGHEMRERKQTVINITREEIVIPAVWVLLHRQQVITS